jgi:hypothetical protein
LQQIIEVNQLKTEKVYLDFAFRAWSISPTALGLCDGAHHGSVFAGTKWFTSCSENELQRSRRRWGPIIPFKGMPSLTKRLPVRFHFLKFLPPSNRKLRKKLFNTFALVGEH